MLFRSRAGAFHRRRLQRDHLSRLRSLRLKGPIDDIGSLFSLPTLSSSPLRQVEIESWFRDDTTSSITSLLATLKTYPRELRQLSIRETDAGPSVLFADSAHEVKPFYEERGIQPAWRAWDALARDEEFYEYLDGEHGEYVGEALADLEAGAERVLATARNAVGRIRARRDIDAVLPLSGCWRDWWSCRRWRMIRRRWSGSEGSLGARSCLSA
mgnify:CR=1 FL=1